MLTHAELDMCLEYFGARTSGSYQRKYARLVRFLQHDRKKKENEIRPPNNTKSKCPALSVTLLPVLVATIGCVWWSFSRQIV